MKRIEILNVNFENTTRKDVLIELQERINKGQKTFLVTANPEIVMYAYNDHSYANIINNADYTIADGIGVIIGSKLINNPLPERIAGFDLMTDLLNKGNEFNWNVYFLGAKKEVVEKAVINVEKSYPNLNVVGWHDGYFDWDSVKIEQEIQELKPDLVFVALGFPKQEYWINSHMNMFGKGLFMGVGGSFDVLAGYVKRAPLIWQKLHLEWLYRLIKQPSRWRRMLVLPLFIIKVIINNFKK